MKKYFKTVLIALLGSAVFFASCKDDDGTKSSECDILSFGVSSVDWSINGTNIVHTYPLETAEGQLTPSISLSPGASINPPASQAQNFFTSQGVRYTVTAEDGVTKKTFTARAVRMRESTMGCEIVSFNVGGVEWDFVDDTLFTYHYPKGTVAGQLAPDIVLMPGATVNPPSGSSQNFYTEQGVKYTVTAADGVTKKTFTARAEVTPSLTGCSIESFSVNGIAWDIDEDGLISYAYPSKTAAGPLTPIIRLSMGASISPAANLPQNFFTAEGFAYTVTAEDGVTTKTYTAKATIRELAIVLANKMGWTATARHAYHPWDDAGGGQPELILDGDVTTGWHTMANWDAPPPHCIVVDMKEVKAVTSIVMHHHPDHPDWIYYDDIRIYLRNESFDPNNDPGDGALFEYKWDGVSNPLVFDLPEPVDGRYVIVYFPTVMAPNPYVSFTELDVYVEE
jgi:hypothetical protein